MATAEEILAAEVCDDILTVDLDSRTIIIPENVTNLGVEADINVRTLHFRVPQHYCDVDLSVFDICINYINANGDPDKYEVGTSTVIDGMIHFDWEVGPNAFTSAGTVTFIVCLKVLDDELNILQEFNTTLAMLPVLPGLETSRAILETYPDLLEQWKSELEVVDPKAIEDAVAEYLETHPVGGVQFETDETLSLVNGVLSVNTADAVEEDNTLPVTSAAVQTVVGNIEVLLKTI